MLGKISLISIGNVFNAVLGFVFLAVCARALGPDEFGKYVIITSLLLLISRMMDFGTNSLFVSDNIKNETQNDISDFYSLKIVLFFICIPLGALGLILFNLFSIINFIIFVIGLAAYALNFTLYALFQREQNFLKVVLLNTLPAFAKLFFAGLIFKSILPATLSGTFFIFCGSVLLDIFFILYLPKKYLKLKFAKTRLLTKLKTAISPGISLLVFESWPTVNNAFIKAVSQFSSVSVFSIASKISNIFTLLSYSIFTVVLPKNAIRKREKMTFNLRELLLLGSGLLFLSVITVTVSKFFILFFLGTAYLESLPILNILIIASAVTAVQGIYESFFFVESQTKYMATTGITKLVVLIVATSLLISSHGLYGVAWANLGAAISGLLLTGFFINKVSNAIR